MRIAIVHDYLKEIGGAERVLMALKEIYPKAPVFTAYKFPKFWGQFKDILNSWEIHESWGRFLPFLPKFISYYTVISPWFFKSFDLSDFDVVIVSQTGGYFPNGVKIGPQTKLITYCHTPPRFLYGYPTATKERNKWYWKPISMLVNHFLRMEDFKLAQRPNIFIANSQNIATRIQKFYRRDSQIVYPPVDSPNNMEAKRANYYLVVSRIVGSKGIELLFDLPKKYKIKVAGLAIGESGKSLVEQMHKHGIEYLGEVNEVDKWKLMAEAKAFLGLSAAEDFGITAVEAQMVGTPVVAFNGGGYKETVTHKKTGILFDDYSVVGLLGAIKEFEKVKFNSSAIKKHAQKFSKERFKKEIWNLVN